MKISSAVVAASMLALLATQASAQDRQQEQQACENDVYALCGEAIPDQDRIIACLKAHWAKVSHECKTIMANYSRSHRAGRNGNAETMVDPPSMGRDRY